MFYFKKVLTSLIVSSYFLAVSGSFANITLPAPQTEGGMPLFEALKKRASTPGGGFSSSQISNDELATLLWSASGLNRGNTGWTVPMVEGKSPYVSLYVIGADGAFLYDWQNNELKEVNANDLRGEIGLQGFTRRAYYSLVFVANSEQLAHVNNPEQVNNFSQIAMGAMSQNIYLAAASLKLNVRYIHSINTSAINEGLHLTPLNQPLGMILVSK